MSIWWMPCPIVGPPPSVSHRPRHGTSKYAWSRNHVVWQSATSGRPSTPAAASALSRRWPDPNRCWKTVANHGGPSPAAAPCAPAVPPCAAASPSNSRRLIVGGFSTSTLAPARRQPSASG